MSENPDIDMATIPLGAINEAGLKSILEDSHFSREFDHGVDLHNLKNDYNEPPKDHHLN